MIIKEVNVRFFAQAVMVTSLCLWACAYGYDNHIRLAVFDNPKIDPDNTAVSKSLEKSYLAGVKTAVSVAQAKGIVVNYKAFFYGDSLLDIIQNVPSVEAWKPDVIVGLHNSNQFLMSKNYFDDRLVLSVAATDPSLPNLPDNFYSLGVPDTYTANAMVNFLTKHYPQANIFLAVETDSKESVDMANLLTNIYQKQEHSKQVTRSEFLADNLNNIDMKRFLQNYHKNDVVIVLTVTYYTQMNLVQKIARTLKPLHPVFLTDVDNWGDTSIPPGINATYEAYRITPALYEPANSEYAHFLQAYEALYGDLPVDRVSFVAYEAVMSVVTALKEFPPLEHLSSEKAVRYSYALALKQNPNWYRPMHFVVYKMQPPKEMYFDTID